LEQQFDFVLNRSDSSDRSFYEVQYVGIVYFNFANHSRLLRAPQIGRDSQVENHWWGRISPAV